MEPNFLFDSVEAAREVAHMLRGEWDECNGVQFVEHDIEALKSAAKLCSTKYCEVGNDCNLREEKSLAQFHQIMKEWIATQKIAIPFSYTLEDNCLVRLMYRDPEIIVNIHYMSDVKGSCLGFALAIKYGNNQSKAIEHSRYRFPELFRKLEKYFSSNHVS